MNTEARARGVRHHLADSEVDWCGRAGADRLAGREHGDQHAIGP